MCVVLCCVVLCCVVLCCVVLCCGVVRCGAVRCGAVRDGVMYAVVKCALRVLLWCVVCAVVCCVGVLVFVCASCLLWFFYECRPVAVPSLQVPPCIHPAYELPASLLTLLMEPFSIPLWRREP